MIWALNLEFDEVRSGLSSQFFVSGPQPMIDLLNQRVARSAAAMRAYEAAQRQARLETWRNRWYAPWRRRKSRTA